MKLIKNKIIFTLFIVAIFLLCNNVYAKTCTYYEKYMQGTTGSKLMQAGAAYLDSKLELTINEDMSADVKTYGNGTFEGGKKDKVKRKGTIENWGKDSDGIGDIKSNSCPDYIAEVPNFKTKFYGFSEEVLNSNSYKLSNNSSSKTIDIYLLDNDSDSNSGKTTEQYFTCTYESFHIDFKKESFEGVQASSNEVNIALPTTYVLKDKISLKDTNDKLLCPKVYVYYSSNITGSVATGEIYYNSINFSKDHPNDEPKTYTCTGGEYCNPDSEDANTCEPYNTALGLIEENQRLYEETGVPKYNELARSKYEELASLCKAIVNYNDFDDGCLRKCLKIHDDVSQYIDVTDNQTCGISSKLLIWVLNIAKWVKYIVPVIVILMGILDFMRAVASDKDDAMKKAQGRFVKRLIAAALIFIVPFIIEFILDKMGFGIKGCNVTDILK